MAASGVGSIPGSGGGPVLGCSSAAPSGGCRGYSAACRAGGTGPRARPPAGCPLGCNQLGAVDHSSGDARVETLAWCGQRRDPATGGSASRRPTLPLPRMPPADHHVGGLTTLGHAATGTRHLSRSMSRSGVVPQCDPHKIRLARLGSTGCRLSPPPVLGKYFRPCRCADELARRCHVFRQLPMGCALPQ